MGYPRLLHDVIESLNELRLFRGIAGLRVNASKSALMPIGLWLPDDRLLLSDTGLPIKQSYKYSGVVLGQVTPEEAYAPALQKALGRAGVRYAALGPHF